MEKKTSIGIIAGVALGAAAAGAAAMALTDKKKRKAIGKTLNDLSEEAKKVASDLREQRTLNAESKNGRSHRNNGRRAMASA